MPYAEVDIAATETVGSLFSRLEASGLSIERFVASGPGGGNPCLLVSSSDRDKLREFLATHCEGDSPDWIDSQIR